MLSNRVRRLNEIALPGHMMFGPKHIILGVNNFCNLRCIMCDVGTGNSETNFGGNLTGAKFRSMPWEVFKLVADESHALWPKAHLGFVYTEPLAWPLIGKSLHYARELGQWTSITTNGLLLTRWAKDIAAGHCGAVSVSLDGPEAIHDRIRRKTGSFAKAIEGIEALAALPNPPRISVYCAISEFNAGALREFLQVLREFPLEEVGLLHTNFVTAKQAERHNHDFGDLLHATSSNVFEVDPARVDLALLSEELSEISTTRYPFKVRISPGFTSLRDLTVYYRHPEIPMGRTCRDAFNSLMVDPDGEIIPVHGRCYRFPIANVRDGGLRQAWNHEKVSGLRKTLSQSGGLLPACTRCCGGFSGGRPKQPREAALELG
jgi:MoaA/NifB/PqqE/SkfB family radical SAM enzyme